MSEKLTPTISAILDAVRTRVVDGTYRVGEALPSENDLAAELRVSRGSVRKAIELLVHAGELSRERHSRPSVARLVNRLPSHDQTDVYVWLAQTVRDGTSLPFLQGVSSELAGTQFRMVAREPSFFVGDIVRADEEKFLADLLHKPHVAGAIIWRDAFGDHVDAVSELLRRGMPLVFVDSPAPGNLPADHVTSSNAFAAKQCVKHLLDLGHRRIACVTDSDVPPSIGERIRGYWRAMRQAGLDAPGHSDLSAQVVMPRPTSPGAFEDEPLGGVYAPVLGPSRFYTDLAHRLVSEILALDPMPTALFVTYDVLAVWVCAVLEGHGIRVPQDISVVGFDRRARWDNTVMDYLTTASQDFEGFARQAVELLLDRFSGDAPAAPRQVLLDAPLVIRSSTASLRHVRPQHGLATLASG